MLGSSAALWKEGKSGVWLEQHCHAVQLGAVVAEVAQQRGKRDVTFHGGLFCCCYYLTV